MAFTRKAMTLDPTSHGQASKMATCVLDDADGNYVRVRANHNILSIITDAALTSTTLTPQVSVDGTNWVTCGSKVSAFDYTAGSQENAIHDAFSVAPGMYFRLLSSVSQTSKNYYVWTTAGGR